MNNKSPENLDFSTKNNINKKEKLNLIKQNDIETVKQYAERVLPSEKAKAGMFYARFRQRFLKTVEVLAETSKLLPEKEKKHVLTAETVKPLIEAFLTYEKDEKSKVVENERAFMIAYLLAMKGEGGFDMLKTPYNILLFDHACRKKTMLLVMQLTEMRFLR
jgi:hypothetical protein